jgi:hypothetical protein
MVRGAVVRGHRPCGRGIEKLVPGPVVSVDLTLGQRSQGGVAGRRTKSARRAAPQSPSDPESWPPARGRQAGWSGDATPERGAAAASAHRFTTASPGPEGYRSLPLF